MRAALHALVVAGLVLPPLAAGAVPSEVGPDQVVLVDGEPFLPIMQFAQSPWRIPEEVPLGINTFVGNGASDRTSQEFLDACAAAGVWGVVDPSDMSVVDHSALLGWVFGDEPDLESHATEPAVVQAEYDALRAADPDHVALLTLTAGFYSEMNPPDWMGGSRDRYFEYGRAADLLGFDIYPIYGWCQPDWLHRVGDAQQELASTYAPERATYQWIEAVRTSSQWCELEERGEDDGPTAAEVRNEVWQAIVHGARAIGYFTHSWECPEYTQICLSETLEQELVRTNGQLTALTNEILAPVAPGAVTAQAAGGGRIDVRTTRWQGRLTVFAVLVGRTAEHATFTVDGVATDAVADVIDEGRTVAFAGGRFEDDFEPLGVHIYSIAAESPDPGQDAGSPDPDRDAGSDDGDGGEEPPPGASSDDGCGCSAAPRPAVPARWLVAGLLLLSALARRPRRPWGVSCSSPRRTS